VFKYAYFLLSEIEKQRDGLVNAWSTIKSMAGEVSRDGSSSSTTVQPKNETAKKESRSEINLRGLLKRKLAADEKRRLKIEKK
jgi:hypothetical protein